MSKKSFTFSHEAKIATWIRREFTIEADTEAEAIEQAKGMLGDVRDFNEGDWEPAWEYAGSFDPDWLEPNEPGSPTEAIYYDGNSIADNGK